MDSDEEETGSNPSQLLFLQRFLEGALHGELSHSSNEELIKALIENDSIKAELAIQAFRSVDRHYFLGKEIQAEAYCDAPIRVGKLHQSAPSIYSRALEALELKPGMSFLNVGSGSGYFSALVHQIIGPTAVHIGVERHAELVDVASQRCAELGLRNIQFIHGNCFSIDVDRSMKFDRIYIGAGAHGDAKFLFKLLKYNGVVVGPFENEGGLQGLLKARCRGNKKYMVSQLLPVQFAELIKPSESGEEFDIKRIFLQGPTWDAGKLDYFPTSFLYTVRLICWMSKIEGSLPNKLPWELWTKYIFANLSFDSFEPLPTIITCATCSRDEPTTQCGRCKKVYYCGRGCQRKDWPTHKLECQLRSPTSSQRSSDA